MHRIILIASLIIFSCSKNQPAKNHQSGSVQNLFSHTTETNELSEKERFNIGLEQETQKAKELKKEFAKKINEGDEVIISNEVLLDSETKKINRKKSFGKKVFQEDFEPSFKIGIENHNQERLPFDTPDDSKAINRTASFKYEVKTSDNFSVLFKSNVANVDFDPQKDRGQLDITPYQKFNNLDVRLKVSF